MTVCGAKVRQENLCGVALGRKISDVAELPSMGRVIDYIRAGKEKGIEGRSQR